MLPGIEGLPTWQLATAGRDARLVDFGDSHAKTGFGATEVLAAMLSPEILYNRSIDVPSMSADAAQRTRSQAMEGRLASERSCEVRQWFATAYHQSYTQPFNFPSELAKNWSRVIEG
jgi:hypothetical protein